MEKELTGRNKWGFASNCIPRDLTYVLVSLFFLTFIQYTCGFTNQQFIVLSSIIVLCRVWDAVNDPMMSTIITNTKSRFGRYRPWILIGAISNSVFLVLMFLSPGLTGWGYVAYLGIAYLLYGMTFTMNDVSYWSLLPHLARSKDSRDKLTGLVAIFASVGSFISGGLIPILTTGNMIIAYRIYAIVAALLFIVSQLLVFLLVKDKNDPNEEKEKNVSLKDMFKIIFNNKQLLVMAAVVLLYSSGSVLLNAFGTNFFYFKFGYDGTYMTIFTVIYALGTIVAQILFAGIAKKHKRADIVKVTTILLVVGYLVFFGLCNLPIEWFGNKYVYLVILCLIGIIIFAAQGIFYLTMLVMLTNTIEYDEWKTGRREEAIVFSVRPFMVKLSTALQQGILTLVLVISGLFSLTNQLSDLEAAKAAGEIADITEQANAILSTVTPWQMLGLTAGMCVIPVLLYILQYILIKKKYIIDEEMYEKMLLEIDQRKNPQPVEVIPEEVKKTTSRKPRTKKTSPEINKEE